MQHGRAYDQREVARKRVAQSLLLHTTRSRPSEWLLLGRLRKGSFYIFERIKRTATADRIASGCIRQ